MFLVVCAFLSAARVGRKAGRPQGKHRNFAEYSPGAPSGFWSKAEFLRYAPSERDADYDAITLIGLIPSGAKGDHSRLDRPAG